MAALPTVTEVSRTSLLCGRLTLGAAAQEKAGFASHAALLAQSRAGTPPRLFHKGDLADATNLAPEVRAAIADPHQRVIGVVYNPITDESFYAARGAGAFLNGAELPLRAGATELRDAVAGVDFKRISHHLGDELAVRPPYYSQRNFGSSALEWCYVAAGRLDVYIHGGQMLWDYAAGRLILEEAGGSYSSLGGTPLTAGPAIKRSVIAAASPALFEQWRTWLHAHA